MKKIFMSFANKRFKKALKRLKSEVKEINIFDDVIGITPRDFDESFRQIHGNFIKKYKRGYGFYIWKPYIIHKVLKLLKENDILVYADAGCKIYPEYLPRLLEYFEIVQKSQLGLLCFELKSNIDVWTKADLGKRLDVLDRDEIWQSKMIAGGILVMRNCPHVRMVIKQWEDISNEDYHCIDNSPSKISNHPDFTEHRHDQSILSILVRIHGAEIIPDETYPPGSGPISADRLRK